MDGGFNLSVDIDATAWFPPDTPQSGHWQSVTCDEIKIRATPRDIVSPALSDLGAVRRYFRQAIAARKGALISCDVIAVRGVDVVRTIPNTLPERDTRWPIRPL